MKNTMQTIKLFVNDESGQSLIEYALVAGIIGLGAVLAMTNLGSAIKAIFSTITNQLINAT